MAAARKWALHLLGWKAQENIPSKETLGSVTWVANSGEQMKAKPGKSSFCWRAGTHRPNKKHSCGKQGAALNQNWILGLCQSSTPKPIAIFSCAFIFTLMNMVLSSSDRKSCCWIPKTSQMVAGLLLIVFSLAVAEFSRVWERGLLLLLPKYLCVPTAWVAHVRYTRVFCLPGKNKTKATTKNPKTFVEDLKAWKSWRIEKKYTNNYKLL